MFEKVKRRIKRKQEKETENNIALLIDGPNMLRGEFNLDLDEVKTTLSEYGSLKIGKVFLDQYAPEKLIEAVINQGFEPTIITTADVDAPMATDAMEAVYNNNIDTIALMTRDSDFQRVFLKAKERGKNTIVLGSEPIAAALKNTVDQVINL